MKITFFQHFHRGDLHISREFVRKIMNEVLEIQPETTFSYAHVNDPCLLSDIDGLDYENLNGLGLNQFENLTKRGNTVFINTWYAQQNFKYMNEHGMTLDCLYAAFTDTCKTLFNFTPHDVCPDPSAFIPTIDYSKFKINAAKAWLDEHSEAKVFVSNGQAMSGQADNFNLTPIICQLALEHPNKTFILSNIESPQILPNNVIYSKDIIQKIVGSDLNENAYLTEHCDLIIGRASGAFSYAWTQNNLLKRKCTFLAFCQAGVMTQKGYQFWTSYLLYDKIKYSAQIVESQETQFEKVKSIISKYL